MRQHPLTGAQILAPLEFFGDGMLIVRHHHERFDGSGYPDGLRAPPSPSAPASSRWWTFTMPSRPTVRIVRALPRTAAVERLRRAPTQTLDGELVALFLDLHRDGSADTPFEATGRRPPPRCGGRCCW